MSPYLGSRRSLRAASALALAVTTGLTALVALPTTADAAATAARLVIGEGGRTFDYTAAPGQTNKLSVTTSWTDGKIFTYVIDDVVPIDLHVNDDPRCTRPDSADLTKVSCTNSHEYGGSGLRMDLGDGNDTITYNNTTGQTGYQASIELGSGNDRATDIGSADGNYIQAGKGDDNVTVGSDAIVEAQDGNDTVHVGDRSIVTGQKGVDRLYADGVDSKADGGTGNDFIYGSAGHQVLTGGIDKGNDTIRGGAGDDWISGDPGNDVLYGNSGNDTIYGNAGNDKVYGGPGRDTLSGGPGRNVVHQD
ncbi:calcium-binding protein [Streptomyces sp. SID12501]|uniref:Calcium-binding protein n=1 Tax=Streptomyces sp. SID12501 TaxID=2706042 RepID=A0A6B3BQ49_9ACTN|nr:calcium-binding protein [Streptomyces sp. SID12501]NEC86452.1 calcium-binding protein [Streptomyces sp. SID12501]